MYVKNKVYKGISLREMPLYCSCRVACFPVRQRGSEGWFVGRVAGFPSFRYGYFPRVHGEIRMDSHAFRERLANQANNDLQIRLFRQLSSARVVLMGRNKVCYS